MKALVSNITSLEPYVVLTGEDLAYLVIDKQIVDQVTSVQEIPFLLMSAFFVFNICYPKGCNNFYSFLEVIVLNFSPEKATPSVKYLLTKVCNVFFHLVYIDIVLLTR